MFVLFQLRLESTLSNLPRRRVARRSKMYTLLRTIPQLDPGGGADLLDAESDRALQRPAHVQQQAPALEDTPVRLEDQDLADRGGVHRDAARGVRQEAVGAKGQVADDRSYTIVQVSTRRSLILLVPSPPLHCHLLVPGLYCDCC